MRLPQPSMSLIYLLLTFVLFLGAMAVEVNIRETAIFTCNGSCNGHLFWTFKTDKENLDILKCVQNNCTEGGNFKDRIRFTPGTISLSLYSVRYNDEGLYMAHCDSNESVERKFLCNFYLKVLVPTTVSTSVGSNVTLHCYAHTEKQITDDTVNILWKKDDQMVLEVKKGVTTYGSGFENRASVSLPHYKDGDLSLNILRATTSDKGRYRCYHRNSEEHGFPGSVHLTVTAEQKSFPKKFGDDLSLDLFGSDHVNVTFTSHDAAETGSRLVCRVTGNNTACSPDYSHRVSLIKGFLVVQSVTSSDTGTFTVRDENDAISVNTVTVEGVHQRHYFITVSVLIGFLICIFLIVWSQGRPQTKRDRQCTYNAVPSDVVINTEPACIALSQQETNPEPEVCPRTPVEETMPENVRTTEKQDNIEE